MPPYDEYGSMWEGNSPNATHAYERMKAQGQAPDNSWLDRLFGKRAAPAPEASGPPVDLWPQQSPFGGQPASKISSAGDITKRIADMIGAANEPQPVSNADFNLPPSEYHNPQDPLAQALGRYTADVPPEPRVPIDMRTPPRAFSAASMSPGAADVPGWLGAAYALLGKLPPDVVKGLMPKPVPPMIPSSHGSRSNVEPNPFKAATGTWPDDPISGSPWEGLAGRPVPPMIPSSRTQRASVLPNPFSAATGKWADGGRVPRYATGGFFEEDSEQDYGLPEIPGLPMPGPQQNAQPPAAAAPLITAPPPPPPKDDKGGGGGDFMGMAMKMLPMLLLKEGGDVPGFMRGGYPELRTAPVRKFDSGGANYVDGYSDSDGRADDVDARLSPKEYVIDAETMSMLGDGNPDHGAKKMDQFRVNVRKHKGKALAKGKFSPNAKKNPAEYLVGNPMGDGIRRLGK